MDSVLSTVQKIGPARIAAMAVVAALLIGFFGFITIRVSKPPMAPLYTDLSFDDSTGIVEFLESQGVAYELSNNGGSISIDQDKILRTRMALASEGLPLGGNVGYEIFDRTDTLGTTSFVQNINHVRALEGELARTITSINRIRGARVHLVIPERQLFQREQKPPTASIALKVRGVLDQSQIRAIQHLVASAIDGLSPTKVSIVDETGTLLASGNGPAGAGLAMQNAQGRATQVQDQLRNQITDLLSGVVGPGRARVQVSAELEMNRVTQTSDVYDPESQVVRSTQSRSQESESQERRPNAGVSVGNELPTATADANTPDETEATANTEEVVNYEISRTTTTQVKEAGAVKRLSVAVLVDGTYTKNEDGTYTYAPRSDEELARLATLVRSAVGFNEGRGDLVEVVNLEFAEKPVENPDLVEEAEAFEFTKYDYFRIAELAVMAILTLFVLLLVVRPLLRRVLDNTVPESLVSEQIVNGTAATQGAISGNNTASMGLDPNNPASQQIAEAMKQGAVRSEVVSQIGEMVNTNPDAAAGVVRNLIREAA
ncbi:MAG: flagellar basal-body MS-ring/collar protein FliF [Hyphomicrobiales bacterium]